MKVGFLMKVWLLMKHRSLLLIAVISCFMIFSVQTVLASSVKPDEKGAYRPTIYINGEKQELKGVVPPSGSTLVPFREFFSILKIVPQFDNKTKTLTAKNDETTITLTAGKRVATLNGKKVSLLQSPSLSGDDDIFYVNLRFIAEAFGGVITFDKETTNG
jgi:hypothetical protein